MERIIAYEDLTPELLEMAESNLLALYEYMAKDGDEEDKEDYRTYRDNRNERLERLQMSKLWLMDNGGIEVEL